MQKQLSRRQFLQHSLAASGTLCLTSLHTLAARSKSPNDRLQIGLVGVSGQGQPHLQTCLQEDIVALCDIDATAVSSAQRLLPKARAYQDFRTMLDRQRLDAVVIATPDHTHAVIACQALQAGCHVYCADPLSRTISEARTMAQLARKKRRITQMGGTFAGPTLENQILPWLQQGALGDIQEAHAWTQRSHGEFPDPASPSSPPSQLDYNLWLGPVFPRPFSQDYLPGKWRHWWQFGGGTLADVGSCFFSFLHRTLDLTTPHSVQAWGPPFHLENTPAWLVALFEYERPKKQPPITVTWYHGGPKPTHHTDPEILQAPEGILLVGSTGKLLLTPSEAWHLNPASKPIRIASNLTPGFSPHRLCDWMNACRNGSNTEMPFEKAAAVTETIHLGNIAYRTDRKLRWNSKRMEATNLPEAAEFVQHSYRPGWWIG